MKKGMKEQTTRVLFTAVTSLVDSYKNTHSLNLLNFQHWSKLYLLLSSNFYNFNLDGSRNFDSPYLFVNDSLSYQVIYDNFLSNDFKVIENSFYIKNFLLEKLSQISPIFSYFIYSVDKNIKKYSRGKSGKYVFIWKYIAPYKRLNLTMKWVAKEIKFTSNKKIQDRISSVLALLINDFKSSFAWKSKTFSHNYVFRNLRKTLMSTLKTSSIA